MWVTGAQKLHSGYPWLQNKKKNVSYVQVEPQKSILVRLNLALHRFFVNEEF
jgi:hypothetical protein